jgi:plastocyanin
MKKLRTKLIHFGPSVLALAILSAMMLKGASASTPAELGTQAAVADSVTEVKIDNFAFTPGVITVKAGTQITWINHDDIPHTVDSTEGRFKSAALDTDDKFQFLFKEPGEYSYFCRMHPKMTGKIIVQQ